MRWSREEIFVLVTIFHSSSFSIGDDEREECRRIAAAIDRSPSAVDRQWRNIADVKKGRKGLRVTKLISECLVDYMEDPKASRELTMLICRQRGWEVEDLVKGND